MEVLNTTYVNIEVVCSLPPHELHASPASCTSREVATCRVCKCWMIICQYELAKETEVKVDIYIYSIGSWKQHFCKCTNIVRRHAKCFPIHLDRTPQENWSQRAVSMIPTQKVMKWICMTPLEVEEVGDEQGGPELGQAGDPAPEVPHHL